MPVDDSELIDVSDMPLMHLSFRRGLGEARGQLSFIDEGDTERAAHFAAYISELLWLLHAHHESEDEVLYPRLVERAPEHAALFARMDEQHAAVESSLSAAMAAADAYGASSSATDAATLADACEELWAVLQPHLTEEEDEVLPIAARTITEEEWGQLPGHALMAYRGERVWLPFGLATEAFPAEAFEMMLAAPTPIGAMWTGGGGAAFAQEMALVRDPSAWGARS